jgi:hypothetical protein
MVRLPEEGGEIEFFCGPTGGQRAVGRSELGPR